MTAITEDFF